VDYDNRKAWKQFIEAGGSYTGFHLEQSRRTQKVIPAWAVTWQALEAHIMRSARRRLFIAERYWRRNITIKEIADELGESEGAVKQVIARLRNT